MSGSAAPDLLVLGGGGVLGDTWMCSVLAGLEGSGRLSPAGAGRFLGTSAGSIVATRLAAGVDFPAYVEHRLSLGASDSPPDRPGDGGAEVELQSRSSTLHRLRAAALPLEGSAGRWIRRTVLQRIPEGQEELSRLGATMDRIAPEWDPRLKITGVRTTTGERVVFSQESGHGLRVSEAVRASCAIPGVFRPVEGSGGSYVDGGVWSPANLDAVQTSSGEKVLALLPIGAAADSGTRRYRFASQAFRSIVAGEMARLRGRGVRLAVVAPDSASAAAIGPDRMDGRREARVGRAGLSQGEALSGPLSEWLSGS